MTALQKAMAPKLGRKWEKRICLRTFHKIIIKRAITRTVHVSSMAMKVLKPSGCLPARAPVTALPGHTGGARGPPCHRQHPFSWLTRLRPQGGEENAFCCSLVPCPRHKGQPCPDATNACGLWRGWHRDGGALPWSAGEGRLSAGWGKPLLLGKRKDKIIHLCGPSCRHRCSPRSAGTSMRFLASLHVPACGSGARSKKGLGPARVAQLKNVSRDHNSK